MREKVFRNSSGFRFNVSFVDCTSVVVNMSLNDAKFYRQLDGDITDTIRV